MCAQKRLPRGGALRRRWQSGRFQDPANGRAAHAMPDVFECALDPRVSPGRILGRHAHDELTDLAENSAAVGSPRVCPFASDQLTMPPQQGVWRRDRRNLPQDRTPDLVTSRGQPAAIVIGQPQPPIPKLTPQKPILFDQVRDGLPLAAIQPSGQHHQHDLQRGGVDHEPDLISWLGANGVGRLVEHYGLHRRHLRMNDENSRAKFLNVDADSSASPAASDAPDHSALYYRARNPCVVPPAVYVPTMSPSGLIPWAIVAVAPGTSIVVKLPCLSRRNP